MTDVGSRLGRGQSPTGRRAKRLTQERAAGVRIRKMENWYYFWTLNFIVAGSAFCVIAIIVSIRGIKDLRQMLSSLRHHATEESRPSH